MLFFRSIIAVSILTLISIAPSSFAGETEKDTRDTVSLNSDSQVSSEIDADHKARLDLPSPDSTIVVDSQPRLIYESVPLYPKKCLKKHIGGVLRLRFCVDKEGEVQDRMIVTSSGNRELDSAGLLAARDCRFSPAIKDGLPVEMWVGHDFRFDPLAHLPVIINRPLKMEIPRDAYDAGIYGTVYVKALIGKNGKVKSSEISRSSGIDLFDNNAIRYASQYKFEAGTRGGDKVEQWTVFPVDFFDDVVPEFVEKQTPEYPYAAKAQGEQGTVWIKAFIDKSGSVLEAVVARSSKSEILDKAALKAALSFKFTPAKRKGEFVRVWIAYPVTFDLEK